MASAQLDGSGGPDHVATGNLWSEGEEATVHCVNWNDSWFQVKRSLFFFVCVIHRRNMDPCGLSVNVYLYDDENPIE